MGLLLKDRNINQNIQETLDSVLKDRLTDPSSEMVDALQRLLYATHDLDVTRADITRFFLGLFPRAEETLSVSIERATEKSIPSQQVAKTVDPVSVIQATGILQASQHEIENVAESAPSYSLEFLLEHHSQYLTGQKPYGLRTPDGQITSCRAWGYLVTDVISWLASHYPRPPLPFLSRPNSKVYLINTAPCHPHRPMINAAEINWQGTSVYVEKNISARDLIRALKMFIETIDSGLDFRVVYAEEPPESITTSLGLAIANELRILGAPAHYTRVGEQIRLNDLWKDVKDHTVSTIMVNAKDMFARVGPGTYGLAEWGLQDQRSERSGHGIGDLVVTFLEAQGVPTDKDKIVSYVVTHIACREQSVAQRLLKDERFQRHGKDKYGLSKWIF